MDKILKDFNFIIDLKVDWGDMDALQSTLRSIIKLKSFKIYY